MFLGSRSISQRPFLFRAAAPSWSGSALISSGPSFCQGFPFPALSFAYSILPWSYCRSYCGRTVSFCNTIPLLSSSSRRFLGINSVDGARFTLTFQSSRLLPLMSNPRTPSVISFSIPKAGVAKRSKKTILLSDKPFAISIIYDTLSIETVKYTRY